MDALIKISAKEFNEELFHKLKQLIKGHNAEIAIAVKDTPHVNATLGQAIEDVEAGKATTYSMEALEAFIKN